MGVDEEKDGISVESHLEVKPLVSDIRILRLFKLV